ncbi:CCHC-type domain-containing protein [Aphis craccivora]|uniref:CCHC-type domain-containing protein n=1 Tax=Aphis craccivora TaxID=307492 RepID=A0A6G0VW06_APHCR|nr:CCHC-type domain-containing protein [Aphis craccivora]
MVYFKCEQYENAFCKASLKVLNNGEIKAIKPNHTHGIPQNDKKKQARKEASSLYPWSTAEKIMRYSRKMSLPELPNSLEALALLFDNGELNRFSCIQTTFYRGCVQDDQGHYNIIFGCPELISSVVESEVEELHVDGTFKVVPTGINVKQLLVLHCMIQSYSIPVCYVLMQSKRRPSYECVIRYIRQNLLQDLNISLIITDYESALKDTLLSYFPQARAVGCWFHHNQAVWRKMKKLGYLHLVNANESALKCLKLLLSLPLLPADDIENGFFDYYRRFWILRVGVLTLSVKGCPRRTNNNVESFHKSMQLKFSVSHPNLWVFLEQLSHLSENYHIIVDQLSNGLQPTKKLSIKFLANSARIRRATEAYNLRLITMRQFLERCSYSMAAYEIRQRHWALGVQNGMNEN